MPRRRFSRSALFVLAYAALFAVVPATADAGPFSLAADWSYTSNPNGSWSYNVGSTPLASTSAWFGGSDLWWVPTSAGGPPGWGKTTEDPFSYGWEIGDVIVHSTTPSSGLGIVNVTWTSPVDAIIDISGSAWDAHHDSDRDDMWTLSLNGVALAQRNSIYNVARDDAAAQFASNLLLGQTLTGLSVNAGDVLEFSVAPTTSYGHFIGVDLNIETSEIVNPVPEPATLVLLSMGLAGMRAVRRRWR